MPDRHRPAPRRRLSDEIAEIDTRLASMLAERTRLLARAAAARLAKGGRAVDPVQERNLRQAWDEAASRGHLDKAQLRRLFTMANAMAYQLAERPQRPDGQFGLKPKEGPVAVDAQGLVSQRHAACQLILAAAAGQYVALGPVALADPLVEIVKAFNQIGGKLSWDAGGLAANPHAGLEFGTAAVFAGESPLTLYALLALALPHAGRVSFTGGTELKLLDLSALAPYLTPLGARLASITPNTRGLPARLESGERMAVRLRLGPDCPPDFAAALALAAWTYPEGLTLEFAPDSAVAEALAPVATILRQNAVACRSEPGLLAVSPGAPQVPERPELPLDPVMAGTLLALPRLAGGHVRLRGRLPQDTAAGRQLPDLLRAVGLDIRQDEQAISAAEGPGPKVLDMPPVCPELEPLALALAAACPTGARLDLAAAPDPAATEDFLAALGKPFRMDGQSMVLAPGFEAEAAPLVAATPAHALALALASYARPRLVLDNPGILTALWPGFWPLFNRLSQPVDSLTVHKEPSDDEPKSGPAKRRYILG